MKKFLVLVIVFLLVAIFNCKSFVKNSEIEADVSIVDNPVVTLQFSSWGSKTEVDIIQSVIADFQAEYPNIKIEFMHIPQNYFQKIHLLFASNKAPDVVFLNNQYLPIYANAGKLEALSYDLSVYDSKIIDALSWNGKLYAVPRDISMLVVYYNKNLFDQAGVAYPSNDWSQKQMLKKALKIKKKTGAFGISFEEDPLFYLPYVISEGGSFYDFESKKTQRALKNYANLRYKYEVAPTRSDIGSATMAQMFLQEKIAMHLSGRWLTPMYSKMAKFEWDIVPFPSGAVEDVSIPLDASGWAISKSSLHKEEALVFVKYLASKMSIKKLAKTGLIVPARNDVGFSNSDVYQLILEKAKPTPVSIDYNKVLDVMKIKNEALFNKIER